MINKQDPKEVELLSRYRDLLCPEALELLENGVYGIIRRSILRVLPVERLEEDFSKETGRPTKELYSMAGLLFLKEYFNWSLEETRFNYMADLKIQYALNIEKDGIRLGGRTLERYLSIFRRKELAKEVMERVTETLFSELDIEIREQRLDSTHVFSNMAAWTRKRLLFRIVQRFLNQVRRHENDRYYRIDCAFRERYERDNGWIFSETSPMKLSRNGKVFTTEEQLGYDMEKLIEEFHTEEKFTNMTSYKDLVRVFQEQFVDHDGKAELRAHPGGKILVNPSDREAEIGHKGVGYQAQVTETSSPENDVQLVTSVIVQGGSESDMNSLPEVVEKLEGQGLLPEKLLADQGYGSDENYVKCAKNEVELIAPAPPKVADKIGLEKCEFDLEKKMTRCPAGNNPMKKEYFHGKGRAVFHKNVCEKCPLKDQCRVRKYGKRNYAFFYTDADLRTAKRRRFEATEPFKNEYRRRCGIEGLFGRLKQFTPLRRLRVRGRNAVSHSIYMIFAMHNVMQAVRYFKIQAQKALAEGLFAFFMRGFHNHCAFLILQAQ